MESSDKAMAASMSSSLSDLPLELVGEISGLLDFAALCAFRLTCKSLYECTLPYFGSHFEAVTTNLSKESLHRLQALSQNQRLGPYVRSLDINGGCDDVLGSGLTWKRHDAGLLIKTQESIQQWQEVLRCLPNCQSFRIHQSYFDDGPFDVLIPADAVTILLSIVNTIKRPLQELTLSFIRSGNGGAGHLNMSRVNQDLLQQSKSICSSLKTLTLRYTMSTEGSVNFAVQLIKHATHLQSLNINPGNGDFDDRLFPRLYSIHCTQPLRELILETAHVGSSDAFISFLAPFQQSLVKVSFAAIHLDSGDWASVLRFLSEFPLLAEISTYMLGVPGGFRAGRLHFPGVMKDPVVDPVLGTQFSYKVRKYARETKTIRVSYSGQGSMKLALQKLAGFATPC